MGKLVTFWSGLAAMAWTSGQPSLCCLLLFVTRGNHDHLLHSFVSFDFFYYDVPFVSHQYASALASSVLAVEIKCSQADFLPEVHWVQAADVLLMMCGRYSTVVKW